MISEEFMILTHHGINSLKKFDTVSIVTISGNDYEYKK